MESSLQKIIAAIVGVMILFIIPVYIAFEKVDDISYGLVLKFTQSFVDNVREKGYISPDMYSDFVGNIYSTNNSYDIQIEHIKKRYDPAIYIYDTNGEILHILDYDKYINEYNSGKEEGNIQLEVGSDKYTDSNSFITVGHVINEERITDKQIVSKLFSGTNISKEEFLSDCLAGNVDLYNSLAYINENSYTMNEGDQIVVTVKNRNTTIASTFYSLLTANVGNEDVAKIYVNYGGSIKNDGGTLLNEQEGSIYNETGRLFKYKGVAEEVTLTPGTYKIECWGASGGGSGEGANFTGGKGAYVSAKIIIKNSSKTFYVYVGGTGTEYSDENKENGGWNGGGNSYQGYGGGGASDIRLIKGESESDASSTDSLLTRIIVAAGGGGSSKTGGAGGYGGDNSSGGGDGSSSKFDKTLYIGKGARRSSIITKNGYTENFGESEVEISYENGSFGLGGDADCLGAGAGGAGFIGGSASHNEYAGGGGGLSYVYREHILFNGTCKMVWDSYKESIENSNIQSFVTGDVTLPVDVVNLKWTDIEVKSFMTYSGKRNNIPNPLDFNGSSTMTGNIGNGYVRIRKIN